MSPARIELFDTPGLDRKEQESKLGSAGRDSGIGRLVLVVGCFAAPIRLPMSGAFQDDWFWPICRSSSTAWGGCEKDLTKPRPDREQLQAEIAALEPIAAKLEAGESVAGLEFSESQDKATKSFSLLTRKGRLVLLNTADGTVDEALVKQIEAGGQRCVSAPVGLELEVQQLPPEDRETFAHEMGLGEPCATKVLQASSR